ncbi:MAG: PLP-dependent aspartate aminotransferase family protein [Acidobacteriota bacterium]|nr:PLP-dependent aspartate aminotransferase family protein [Acidobacteriota bacterium]MDH3525042.1 PLP-dependent aspartate aminotransferase family protein [Acidobacteriota bacterium]
MKGDPKNLGFSTRAIHAGQQPDPATGALNVPIYATSTYVQDALGEHKGFEYARVHNPTRTALEVNVANLEGGLSGHAFASGMAAISTLMTVLSAGDHVVASHTVYGGTYRLLTQVLDRYGIASSWVDSSDLANVEDALTERTRMVYVETPTNPMMEITDLAGAAAIAHRHGAILAVDNTFASPALQRPIEHGADVVVHSATKFLNGHSDALGGILVANRQQDSEWFAFVQKSAGAVLGPFDAFLTLRGIKTLVVRMEKHETSGRIVAEHLASHPKVGRVFYPGLPDHPGRAIHERQASGFGALISFDLGGFAAAKTFLDRVRVMSLAESLGGVETLISHPASMTHASVPAAERQRIGIVDGLVRVSVGLENVEDLLADLDAALAPL